MECHKREKKTPNITDYHISGSWRCFRNREYISTWDNFYFILNMRKLFLQNNLCRATENLEALYFGTISISVKLLAGSSLLLFWKI